MVPIFPVLTHIGNFASANYCVSRWWAFISDVTNDWTLILLKCKKIYIIFHAHNLNLVNLTIITQNNTKINYIMYKLLCTFSSVLVFHRKHNGTTRILPIEYYKFYNWFKSFGRKPFFKKLNIISLAKYCNVILSHRNPQMHIVQDIKKYCEILHL